MGASGKAGSRTSRLISDLALSPARQPECKKVARLVGSTTRPRGARMKTNEVLSKGGLAIVLAVVPLCATALSARELPRNPHELMQQVVDNELKAELADHTSWRYLEQ